MAKYTRTLASLGSAAYFGYEPPHDEVYVKLNEKLVAIFFGPTSWGDARRYIATKEDVNIGEAFAKAQAAVNTGNTFLRHELNFIDTLTGRNVSFFFKTEQDREYFIRLNPAWEKKCSFLHRHWCRASYGLVNTTLTYCRENGAHSQYLTFYYPEGGTHAVLKDRRKAERRENWMYGVEINPERRKS